MLIATPHGEARVLGTKFTLTVRESATLLEVSKGRVKLTRKKDGAYANVSAGSYAVASGSKEEAKPVSRKNRKARVIFAESFQRSRWSQVWAQKVASDSSPRFKIIKGALTLPFPKVSPAEVAPTGLAPTPDSHSRATPENSVSASRRQEKTPFISG